MFDKKEIEKLKEQIKREQLDHELAIKRKDYELDKVAETATKKLEKELNEANQKIAVLEKENAMQKEVMDVKGDLIDIKDLVNKLIGKLPQVDIKSLTVQSSGKGGEE